jgi:hypothetical protein
MARPRLVGNRAAVPVGPGIRHSGVVRFGYPGRARDGERPGKRSSIQRARLGLGAGRTQHHDAFERGIPVALTEVAVWLECNAAVEIRHVLKEAAAEQRAAAFVIAGDDARFRRADQAEGDQRSALLADGAHYARAQLGLRRAAGDQAECFKCQPARAKRAAVGCIGSDARYLMSGLSGCQPSFHDSRNAAPRQPINTLYGTSSPSARRQARSADGKGQSSTSLSSSGLGSKARRGTPSIKQRVPSQGTHTDAFTASVCVRLKVKNG